MHRRELGTWLIVRITVRILLASLWLTWAVITTFVATCVTRSWLFRVRGDETVARMAVPANSHPWRPVNQIARPGPNWPLQHDFLVEVGIVVAGDDGRVVFTLPRQLLLSSACRLLLGIRLFWWVSGASLATDVLAAWTLGASTKPGLALVALAMDAHARGLFDS